MYRLIVNFLVFATVYGFPKDSALLGMGERIIGGSKTELGQFPYQAELSTSTPIKHFCGGAIVSNKWIITAAHCIINVRPDNIIIRVGSTTADKGGDKYTVEKIIVHEYNEKTKQNDIALLRTKENIEFKTTVQPIKIAGYEVPVGAKVTISGWGYTKWSPSSQISNDLNYIKSKIYDNTKCALAVIWDNNVTKNQICTLSPRGQGACGGDSGGPVVHDGHLVGIVSWGIPCGRGKPDIHTNVYSYVKWIQNIIGSK